MYLARGGDDWQPEAAACTLPLLPVLRLLEFRFSFDEEEPPQNLPSLLLLPQPRPGVPLLPPPPQQPPSLHHLRQQLQHLVLVFPIRSVIPPTEHLPDEMSTLVQVGGWAQAILVLPPVSAAHSTLGAGVWLLPTLPVALQPRCPPTACPQSALCARLPPTLPVQLTSLKLKRIPMVATPSWLGALTQLRNLLWDPALPADHDCESPFDRRSSCSVHAPFWNYPPCRRVSELAAQLHTAARLTCPPHLPPRLPGPGRSFPSIPHMLQM